MVEKAHLSIYEQPENAATPSNAIVESTLGSLQTQIQDFTQQVVALATRSTQRQSQQPAVRWCSICNQVGRLQRQCSHHQPFLYPPRCFHCGRVGHLARQYFQLTENGAPVQGSRRPHNQ